jgi:hypothetical protein
MRCPAARPQCVPLLFEGATIDRREPFRVIRISGQPSPGESTRRKNGLVRKVRCGLLVTGRGVFGEGPLSHSPGGNLPVRFRPYQDMTPLRPCRSPTRISPFPESGHYKSEAAGLWAKGETSARKTTARSWREWLVVRSVRGRLSQHIFTRSGPVRGI